MQRKEFRMTEKVPQDSYSDAKKFPHAKKGAPKTGTPFRIAKLLSLDEMKRAASLCRPLPKPRASSNALT
jgi:hypothetical protein